MNEQTHYDIVVIGGGPAGYTAAIRAAQLGLSVAIVEKNAAMGGVCLNVGCIPSKALLDSSERFAMARQGLAVHGISVENVTFDLGVMMRRKDGVVATLTNGLSELLRANRITCIRGTARFTGPREIEVNAGESRSVVRAERAVIIATGSVPVDLPSVPVDNEHIVDSTGALSFGSVPQRLSIIGGGAIGLELASVWSRLGSKVTVIERLPQLLPGWDGQIRRTLERIMTKQNITILTGASVEAAVKKDAAILLSIGTGEALSEITADRVLVAVGRKPFTDGLGIDELGIAVNPKSGRIPIDNKFMTKCVGVYAIGDCVEGPMLAHKGFEEGAAVAEILAGLPGLVNYKTIPAVVYTSPEAASVGATEENLKERGVAYTAGIFYFKANGRALAMDMPDGFVKVLADAATDAVLGVHSIGPLASELIAEAVSVMEFGGSAEDIARTIHAHPTLSEAVREAALDVDKRAIHVPPVNQVGRQ
jgi:dihydrolipoamide dehydrogenase